MNLPGTIAAIPCIGRRIGETRRVPRAMILGAGFGTRLRPVTDALPKPLLPVGDRSFLEHALDAFAGSGLAEPVIVNVHHLAGAFEQLPHALRARIELVYEPELRGTAGGIAGARSRLTQAPLVVLVGDALLERVPADFAEKADFGGLVLAVQLRALGEGTVGIGEGGRVVRLRGERFGPELESGDYVGLAALGARALAALPTQGCLIGDYALPVLRRGELVQTAPYDGEARFPADDLANYLAANHDWLARRGLTAHVAPSAVIARGVTLQRSLVGAGARVEGEGVLSDSLVLPGALCRAPLSGSIALPNGAVIRVIESRASELTLDSIRDSTPR